MNCINGTLKDYKVAIGLFAAVIFTLTGCQKTGQVPHTSGVAALTVINATPNSSSIIPVINTSQAIMYFGNAVSINFAGYQEYAPYVGDDTVYIVQNSGFDTLDVGPKVTGELFYGILPLQKGGIYSLFLCGSDTTNPDYLFTSDSLPFYPSGDSVTGIRFVNLSAGSNPISINLEGNPNGSEVSSLPYKSITGFKPYTDNSTTQDILFVVRDAATGDSLTQFDFNAYNSYNNGYGLTDPTNNGFQLTFKSITIALIGQPGTNAVVPQATILIDDY